MSFTLKPLVKLVRFGIASTSASRFSPLDLFALGEQGVWYDPSDLTTLFKDAAGTEPVTADGDPVGLMLDKSGNGKGAEQVTSSARPTYSATSNRLTFDKVDDNMSVAFTGSGGFNATFLQGSVEGIFRADVLIPNGAWKFSVNNGYPLNNNILGMILVEGTMSEANIAASRQYLTDKGAGDYSSVTSMSNYFRSRSDVKAIYFDGVDTSNVTTFGDFANSCTNLEFLDTANMNTSNVTGFNFFAPFCSLLTSLDLSNWNTSKVTSFFFFVANCTSLTTITLSGGTGNPFADSICTNYNSAFNNTNLTQQSIDDILIAVNSAGRSNGTFGQSGGSAPSVTGEAAVDGLRARGWTVTVTGGY